MFRPLVAIAALPCILSACQTAPAVADTPAPAVMRSQWQCGELGIDASFDTGVADQVVLVIDGRRITLPHAVSASGARYADDAGNQFWTKGNGGTLSLAEQADRPCTRNDLVSPWDRARERGVRFRAIGQEPGWLAEVGGGDHPPLHAELDYGQRHIDLPRTDFAGDRYRGHASDGTPVELQVQRANCTDAMSGEAFPATAILRVGDRTYHGCGRALME